jgi:DNA-binding CsgD family transcriptional regulator
LHEAIRNSSLAIALVQLPTRRFVEVSRRAAAFFGGEPRAMRGTDALAVSDEPETSGRAWDVIADGLLDGYQARRKLRGSHGAVDSHIWTRVLRRNGADADADAVVIVTPAHGELDWPLDDTDDDREAAVVAHRVGPDREALPHQGPLEYLVVAVLEIVHPDDFAIVLTAIEEALSHRVQVSVVVRVRDEARSWQRSQLSLGPIDDETQSFVFALTGAGEATALVPPRERVIELEQRLQRIAREVEAAGVVSAFGRPPDAKTLPGLADLTSRQWEVVTRLARGERVSEMARGMYLSPSTVRNHLANLFRKVGVHSQSEFLDLLRRHDRAESAPSSRAYVPNA